MTVAAAAAHGLDQSPVRSLLAIYRFLIGQHVAYLFGYFEQDDRSPFIARPHCHMVRQRWKRRPDPQAHGFVADLMDQDNMSCRSCTGGFLLNFNYLVA